jgi:ATP-dependent Clp endopeptidase proteolytic subunit ClpP
MLWVEKTDDDSDVEEDTNKVKVVENDIFFYSGIDNDSILNLNTAIKKLERKLLKRAIDIDGYNPVINLHIKSGGGDIFAGLSGMDHISSCRVPINTIADGLCASAATFLLMGGSTRYIRPSAYVLIHQLSSGFWGKFEDLKNELESCEKFMKIIRGIYEEKATIPQKTLNSMMKRDIYVTAKECLRFGIVDEIYHGNVCTK